MIYNTNSNTNTLYYLRACDLDCAAADADEPEEADDEEPEPEDEVDLVDDDVQGQDAHGVQLWKELLRYYESTDALASLSL